MNGKLNQNENGKMPCIHNVQDKTRPDQAKPVQVQSHAHHVMFCLLLVTSILIARKTMHF